MESKMCETCGQLKDLGQFHFHLRSLDRRQARCKECQHRAYQGVKLKLFLKKIDKYQLKKER